MNLLKTVLLAIALLSSVISSSAMAQTTSYRTQQISRSFTVDHHSTETLSLGNTRYIKNLVVQAEGIRRDSTIEVMVNGEVKGTIYAPGRDPSYVVTIQESASSIQFRHVSGARMRILSVTATLSDWHGRALRSRRVHAPSSDAAQLAYNTLNALDALEPYASLEEEKLYLLPIRLKAGKLIVMANARGAYSRKTAEALDVLQKQIEFSRDYINLLMEQDGLFDFAVELLTVSEQIDEILD